MASVKHPRHNSSTYHPGTHLAHAAADILGDSKKLVNKLYKDGLHKVDWAEDNVKDASTKLVKKVKANPIASVLIAGGIGFILSALLRK